MVTAKPDLKAAIKERFDQIVEAVPRAAGEDFFDWWERVELAAEDGGAVARLLCYLEGAADAHGIDPFDGIRSFSFSMPTE